MAKVLSNVGQERLGDALASSIDNAAELAAVSAHFTVFAYDAMKSALSKLDKANFLFSQPTFIRQLQDAKDPREFVMHQRDRERAVGGVDVELTLKNSLAQLAIARECAAWIRCTAQFKSVKEGGWVQSGNVYHVSNPDGSDHGFMGADADFTLAGLGYETKPGTMMLVNHLEGEAESAGVKSFFTSLWNDEARVEDVTADVIEQIETLYRENSPEYIYFLTLYHLFRSSLSKASEAELSTEVRLQDSVIWNKLYDFQKDAVVGAINKLERYKGCIIADSVGLGKTFEALAVMKYYQERNARILVLTPKRLRDNWTLYTLDNDERNVLADDRLSYTVLNHTDLSRRTGTSGDVNLETLRWGNYDLLVIDESHNFRNKPTDTTKMSRYERLMNDVIRSGKRTRVLMLSATPVNNRLLDLRNQIEIITEGDDAYLEKEGIPSITNVTRRAQQTFREWSKQDDENRTTQSFVNSVNPEYFQLLDLLTIARSRKHITKYYTGGTTEFPERRKPISLHPPIDAEGELPSIADLNDMISRLTFAQHQMLRYVLPSQRAKYEEMYADTWGKDFDSQINRTQAVAGLMRVNLLKRLESSVSSFRITLQRILESNQKVLEMLEHTENLASDRELDAGMFDDEEDYASYIDVSKVSVHPMDLDRQRLKEDLEYDTRLLEELLTYARAVTPDRDKKLQVLQDLIMQKAREPINENNRKVLVFSAFGDTIQYLYDELAQKLSDELGLESAMVSGGTARTYSLKLKRSTFDNVLAHFSPVSKELSDERRAEGEIDVLFATDCISEGQNLQDCDCLVNYDIHWNPVRIVQRFGRIDRLGSNNKQIQLVNFWPDIQLDEYIKLEGRVKGRMALLDASATGEENVLEGKRNDEMNDLKYRRKQLEMLQEETLDLEDMNGGVSITDLAFDDFRAELQRYMEEHPDQLESAPQGLHCVTRVPDALRDEFPPGVIFCIRQMDADKKHRDSNPVFPYYLLYVTEAGDVFAPHTQPKAALDMMRAACTGKPEPLMELCKQFNRKTRDGAKMSDINALLQAAVTDVTGVLETRGIQSLFDIGEVGGAAPNGFEDYSLISFVVLN